MVDSIKSNASAMAALQSLNSTLSKTSTTTGRLSTGFKVANAFDDNSSFTVAQSIRGSVSNIRESNQTLAVAKGSVDTALAATTKISESLQSIRQVTTQLSDANLDGARRTELQAQYRNTVEEIGKTINSATSNGFNALGSASQKVTTNEAGSTLEIGGYDLKAKLALPAEMNSAAAAQAFLGQAAEVESGGTTQDSGVKLADMERAVGNVMNDLGASSRRIGAQINFNSAMQDAMNTSLGAISDADMATESANLQALQVKQQLGVQSLSIANQAPQSLLSLFR